MARVAALARHLREHPDILSNVLEELLQTHGVDEGMSWDGREKRRRVTQRNEEEDVFPLDDLANEVGKSALVSKLVEQARRDEDAFLTLIQLGLVNQELHGEVRRQIHSLETRLDVVKLYARSAFEYFARDDPTFELFLARLRIYAPVTYRAWLLMSRHADLRDKTQQLVRMVRDERDDTVFDDYTEWLSDGEDPLATLVAFHYAVGPASPFTRDEIQQLLPMVNASELALVLQPLSPASDILQGQLTNYYEFVRLAAMRCSREVSLGLINNEDAPALFQQLLVRVPPRNGSTGAVYKQSAFHNMHSDARSKHEMSTLVITLWRVFGMTVSLRILKEELFIDAGPELRILLLTQWLKMAFCERAYGDAYASLSAGAPVGRELMGHWQEITVLVLVQFPAPNFVFLCSLYRLMTHSTMNPKYVFIFLFQRLPALPVVDPVLEEYFLRWAIHRGNFALVQYFFQERWPLIAALPLEATVDLDAWSVLEPLLEAHFVEKHDATVTGAYQAYCYGLLAPWFQRFPIIMARGHCIVPSTIPYGRYLLGEALFDILEKLPITQAPHYPPDSREWIFHFHALSIWRMQAAHYFFVARSGDQIDEEYTFPPQGDVTEWARILRAALYTALPPATTRYVASKVLVPALPAKSLTNAIVVNQVPYWNPYMTWFFLKTPQVLDFIRECLSEEQPRSRPLRENEADREHGLNTIARNIDNPLVFFGQLRRRVNASQPAYAEAAGALIHRLLVSRNSSINYHGVRTLANALFYIRNVVMPSVADEDLPSPASTDDVFNSLPMMRRPVGASAGHPTRYMLFMSLNVSQFLEDRDPLLFFEPLIRLREATIGLERDA
jgi:hypothetical protein